MNKVLDLVKEVKRFVYLLGQTATMGRYSIGSNAGIMAVPYLQELCGPFGSL